LLDSASNGLVLLLEKIAPADTGLVGNDDDGKAGVVQPPNGVRHAGEELGTGRIRQKIAVLDDGAVAIEEGSGPEWPILSRR
jgi:hypothetical protein